MLIPRIVLGIFWVGPMALGAGGVCGQDYPNKPIRIVTSGPTGASGITSRLIAQGISGPLGQQIVVENRGAGTAPQETVSKAPPDGYTMLITGSGHWVEPLLRKTPYDPVTDFAPVSIVSRSPLLLFVHSSLPVKSVKELIAYAKARPGELNNSIGGIGGAAHLAGELFKSMAGVNIVGVPYSSDSQELADLIAGYVQLTFTNAASMAPHVKSGKMRPLAVTSAAPSAVAPDLPTIAASGLPGYEAGQTTGMFVPAKTPEAIINRVNQEVMRFLKTAEAKDRLSSIGIEAVGSSPEQLADKIKSEMNRLGKVIKDAGIGAK